MFALVFSTSSASLPSARSILSTTSPSRLASDALKTFSASPINGFQKKTQKTPKKEIEKALRIMNEYFDYKKKGSIQ